MDRRSFIKVCCLGVSTLMMSGPGCSSSDSTSFFDYSYWQALIKEQLSQGHIENALQLFSKASNLAKDENSYKSYTVAVNLGVWISERMDTAVDANLLPLLADITKLAEGTPANFYHNQPIHFKAKFSNLVQAIKLHSLSGDPAEAKRLLDVAWAYRAGDGLNNETGNFVYGYFDNIALALYALGRHQEALDLIEGIPVGYPQRVSGLQDIANYISCLGSVKDGMSFLDNHVADAYERFVGLTYFNRARPLIAKSMITDKRFADALTVLTEAEAIVDARLEDTSLAVCQKNNYYNKLIGLYESAGYLNAAASVQAKVAALKSGCAL